MSVSAISEPDSGRRALRLGPVARHHHADDHLLAFLDLAPGHLGVGAVPDAELQRDRRGLAVGPHHPYPPGGGAAAPPAARPGAGGTLALRRIDSGRAEAQRRVRDLEHALPLVDDDP